MTSTLSDISNILLYAAMAVYAIAFVAFSMDLASRSAVAENVRRVSAVGATRARRASGATLVAEREGGSFDGELMVDEWDDEPAPTAMKDSRALKIARWVTLFAWVLHLGADIFRGIAAGRVPWANMFEFAMTATCIVVLVFLVVQAVYRIAYVGTFVIGLVLVVLGIATVSFYVPVVPLQPALQSYWLVIHVFVASLAAGFLALGFAMSVLQLLQVRREASIREGKTTKLRALATMPDAERLEVQAYRVIIVGFILWTFTLIAGAIWAQRAWGRPWGWDTKEVWTFIVWVVYAGYIHARATRGWRGARSSWLAIIGFGCVLFNFGIVNVFFKGLHAYSGL